MQYKIENKYIEGMYVGTCLLGISQSSHRFFVCLSQYSLLLAEYHTVESIVVLLLLLYVAYKYFTSLPSLAIIFLRLRLLRNISRKLKSCNKHTQSASILGDEDGDACVTLDVLTHRWDSTRLPRSAAAKRKALPF